MSLARSFLMRLYRSTKAIASKGGKRRGQAAKVVRKSKRG
jgi:hypothetical protein